MQFFEEGYSGYATQFQNVSLLNIHNIATCNIYVARKTRHHALHHIPTTDTIAKLPSGINGHVLSALN